MRGPQTVLVIGPAELRSALAHALPAAAIVAVERPLAGVWRLGREKLPCVLLSLAGLRDPLHVVRCLRQVAPHARIIVTCRAAREPLARQALAVGADEYILEPLLRDELELALHSTGERPAPFAASPPMAHTAVPATIVPTALEDVLRGLGDGPAATLERCALLVRDVLTADAVTLELDELAVTIGLLSKPIIDRPILRDGASVGRISLSRRGADADDPLTPQRIAEYGRLIETCVAQAREQARWRALALTDHLTGLHNRRSLEQTLVRLLADAAERRVPVTLLLFDIDDFKSYNDRYGHEVGDSLLREFTLLLKRCSRGNDLIARLGGDEFAVLFSDPQPPRVPGSMHPADPLALTDRFLRAIAEHEFTCLGPHAPGPVTISGGLASFPWNGSTVEQLLRAADEALLRAKRTGKQRIHLAG